MVAAADLGELTARERDVVLAAADGADTRAIAERLFLRPRTVEHHLSAAYRKLGVANRAALVALLRNSAPGVEVTGGTGGMGRVIAAQLASDGFDVAVAYAVSVDLADATVKEIAGH